jgi:hypothetical protein
MMIVIRLPEKSTSAAALVANAIVLAAAMHDVARNSLLHSLGRRSLVMAGLLCLEWFRYDKTRKTKVAARHGRFSLCARTYAAHADAILIAAPRAYEALRRHPA